MINSAHLHLMFNHFPVIGILFSILLFLYGLAANLGNRSSARRFDVRDAKIVMIDP